MFAPSRNVLIHVDHLPVLASSDSSTWHLPPLFLSIPGSLGAQSELNRQACAGLQWKKSPSGAPWTPSSKCTTRDVTFIEGMWHLFPGTDAVTANQQIVWLYTQEHSAQKAFASRWSKSDLVYLKGQLWKCGEWGGGGTTHFQEFLKSLFR